MKRIGCVLITVLLFACALVPNSVSAGPCDPALSAMGALGGGYIYMTYAFIGASADGFSAGTYKPQQIQAMMKETEAALGATEKALKGVPNLTPSDQRAVNSMVSIMTDLKMLSRTVSAYSQTKSQADAQRYQQIRQRVWPNIKQLLGIK